MSEKEKIRARVKVAKSNHTPEELRLMSDIRMRQLEAHPRFVAAPVVLLFHSLPDEPCTHALLERWKTRKTLLLPAVAGEHLTLHRYEGRESLREGAFHILEPAGPRFHDYTSIRLAVIPGVAFDASGHRVGRGRGFYDRLLALPGFSGVYKLGLCFDFQKFDSVPTDPHDISVDEVI